MDIWSGLTEDEGPKWGGVERIRGGRKMRTLWEVVIWSREKR